MVFRRSFSELRTKSICLPCLYDSGSNFWNIEILFKHFKSQKYLMELISLPASNEIRCKRRFYLLKKEKEKKKPKQHSLNAESTELESQGYLKAECDSEQLCVVRTEVSHVTVCSLGC